MVDWTKYKDLAPFTLPPGPRKDWGGTGIFDLGALRISRRYNEGDKINDDHDFRFNTNFTGVPIRPNHSPCGYWWDKSLYTILAVAGSNGSISPEGSDKYNYGANATYIIVADEGYSIIDVLVDGVSVGSVSSYQFNNIKDDHTISVSFVIETTDPFVGACAIWDFATSGTILQETLGNCDDFTINPVYADNYSWIPDAMGDGGAISLLDLDEPYEEENGILHIPDNGLPSCFPGKVGNSSTEFSVSIFCRLVNNNINILMTKTDFSGSCPCSWLISLTGSKISLFIYSQGSPPGIPYNILNMELLLPLNDMLHIVINYYGDTTKKAVANVYNFETGSLIGIDESEPGTVTMNSTDDTSFILGQSGTGFGTIKMEQIAIFPTVLSTDQIAVIRAAY